MPRNYKKALEPKWLLTGLFFLSGIFLGALSLYIWFGLSPKSLKIHPLKSNYQHINPLLGVDFQTNDLFVVNKSLTSIIQNVINTEKGNKNISDANIYFREMESGDWVGVNENTKFSSDKLLKIPIMITYYKLAESDPELLFKKLLNNYRPATTTELFTPEDQLVFGTEYTVNDLINQMITENDDTAANILFDYVDKNSLNEVFSDMGINFIEDKGVPDHISLKLNSLFFRVLYNSTYLNREFSERAMGLLAEVKDNTGINAGLPKSLSTARRFGGNVYTKNGAEFYRVYDCGVIYYPEHPYLLCVSATGATLDGVESFLKNVSEKVYIEVKYKYKG